MHEISGLYELAGVAGMVKAEERAFLSPAGDGFGRRFSTYCFYWVKAS
jgi:hypothetical protein